MTIIYILLSTSILSNLFLIYRFVKIIKLPIFKNKIAIDEAFMSIDQALKTHSKTLKSYKEEHKKIHKRINFSLSNIKIVKFPALPGNTTKNSFSVIMINDHKDGLIITSLNSIKFPRITIKHILKGKSTEELLPEEKKLLMSVL